MSLLPTPAVDSALASGSKKKTLIIASSLKQKVDDFAFETSDYEVTSIKVEVDELQTSDRLKLLNDKTDKILAIIGPQKCPVVIEDTFSGFLDQNGQPTFYPDWDIKRFCQVFKGLYAKIGALNGYTNATYGCSAMLVEPNGTRHFFTAECLCTLCETRPGPGSIDPQTIRHGQKKAFSEMSQKERSYFHVRPEIARDVYARLKELGY
jgi:inosine/xanthosine triphosphate pyrophosphatase family protein